MSSNIVKDALKYYDTNNEKYNNIRKRMKYIKPIKTNINGINSFKYIFYDKDMNELFSSRIEILARSYNKINTWIWGWGIPIIDKSYTTIIRKVFLYGSDLDIQTNLSNILLKNELVTSRFRIDNKIQIDIHCAIASYLSKKPFIFIWNGFPSSTTNVWDNVFSIDHKPPKNSTYSTDYFFVLDPPEI